MIGNVAVVIDKFIEHDFTLAGRRTAIVRTGIPIVALFTGIAESVVAAALGTGRSGTMIAFFNLAQIASGTLDIFAASEITFFPDIVVGLRIDLAIAAQIRHLSTCAALVRRAFVVQFDLAGAGAAIAGSLVAVVAGFTGLNDAIAAVAFRRFTRRFAVLYYSTAVTGLKLTTGRAAVVIIGIVVIAFLTIGANAIAACSGNTDLADVGTNVASIDLAIGTSIARNLVAIIAGFEIRLQNAIAVHIRNGNAFLVLFLAVHAGTGRRACWRTPLAHITRFGCTGQTHSRMKGIITFFAGIQRTVAAFLFGTCALVTFRSRAFPTSLDETVVAAITGDSIAIIAILILGLPHSIATIGNAGSRAVFCTSIIRTIAANNFAADDQAFVTGFRTILDTIAAARIPHTCRGVASTIIGWMIGRAIVAFLTIGRIDLAIAAARHFFASFGTATIQIQVACTIITFLAVAGIHMAVTAVSVQLTARRTFVQTITTNIQASSKIAGFIAILDTITAIRSQLTGRSTTAINAIIAINTIVAVLSIGFLNDTITAVFTFGAIGIAFICTVAADIVSGPEITAFKRRIDIAIAAFGKNTRAIALAGIVLIDAANTFFNAIVTLFVAIDDTIAAIRSFGTIGVACRSLGGILTIIQSRTKIAVLTAIDDAVTAIRGNSRTIRTAFIIKAGSSLIFHRNRIIKTVIADFTKSCINDTVTAG